MNDKTMKKLINLQDHPYIHVYMYIVVNGSMCNQVDRIIMVVINNLQMSQ